MDRYVDRSEVIHDGGGSEPESLPHIGSDTSAGRIERLREDAELVDVQIAGLRARRQKIAAEIASLLPQPQQ